MSPLLKSWYEREITDLFGLRFLDHPQPHRLVLHEGVNSKEAAVCAGLSAGLLLLVDRTRSAVPELAGAGSDVQLLPFGPVRADVLESAEFLFFYIGEAILHYQPRLFFKHRGMEKRFEGLEPARGVVLAERISGVGSVAHALAYCQAVEAAADCIVPPRAQFLRVLLAEMERLYNHLHYLGHLCHTTTLKVGEAEGKLLEERAKQLNPADRQPFPSKPSDLAACAATFAEGMAWRRTESLRERSPRYARHWRTPTAISIA